MSRERLANAFDKAAEAMAELALELRGADSPSSEAASGVGASAPVAPPPAQRAAGVVVPPAPAASAFTMCPAHKVPWSDGKFGPYCTQQSDDYPDWANDKGYCRVTPKNAGAWLAKHPRAA
jgi:hypothetical protein